MVRNCRDIARTGALTALLLLLLLPAAANAATPGLVGQALAQADGAVKTTTATVGQVATQVNGTVAKTVDAVSEPVRSTSTQEVGKQLEAEVAKPGADALKAVTEAAGPKLRTAAPSAPQKPAHTTSEPRGHETGSAPHRARPTSAGRTPAASLASIETAAAGHPSAQFRSAPAARDLPASELPSGAHSEGHSFSASSGGAAASGGFSAGAFAVLMTALLLAASALRARLPRFYEVGRPLPLIFALERPG